MVKKQAGNNNTLKFILVIVVVAIFLMIVSGAATGKWSAYDIAPGGDGGGGTSNIVANSCDADSTCEVQGRVLSSGNLWLTS